MTNKGRIIVSILCAAFGTFLVVARQSYTYLTSNLIETVILFCVLSLVIFGIQIFHDYKSKNKDDNQHNH